MISRRYLLMLARCRGFTIQIRNQSRDSLVRGPYAKLKDNHVQEFERMLESHRVVKDPTDVKAYNTDWFGTFKGQSRLVLRPKTTEEVCQIMSYCFKENLAVTPQGGNTGLVGGSIPVFDEIILSMSLLNKINHIDEIDGTVTCEAGAVLEKVNMKLSDSGLMAPYDLGSKGTCQIGGNISTCAGGLRLIRYGSMLSNTLGLKAVLSDGSLIDLSSKMRKDNTGYHLRQLFIGSEGTLGIITEASLSCPPLPSSVTLSFLGLKRYEDVVNVYKQARSKLSEILSSCEMMDSVCMESVVSQLGLRCPLSGSSFPFYMVIETHGSEAKHDQEKVSTFLEMCQESGFIVDGTTSSEPSKIQELWKVRERIVDGLKNKQHLYTYDITLPIEKAYYAVNMVRDYFKDEPKFTSISGFGHIGDGNLHLNLTSIEYDKNLESKIEDFLYPWVQYQGGSISSEHGIGFRKNNKLIYGKTSQAIQLMIKFKKAMDPKGILNPYKVLPLNKV